MRYHPHPESKLGMFEQVTNPDTGETLQPISGRGRYNNIKSSRGNVFESRTEDPERLLIQSRLDRDPDGLMPVPR